MKFSYYLRLCGLFCAAAVAGSSARAAELVVTSEAAQGAGSLAEALQIAATNGEADTVTFASELASIPVTTALPLLEDIYPTTIDGLEGRESRMILTGPGTTGTLTGLFAYSNDNVIKNLDLRSFPTAIEILGARTIVQGCLIGLNGACRTGIIEGGGIYSVIGGTTPEERNVISNNNIGIAFASTGGSRVTGNWIGTTGDGLNAAPNASGIRVNGSSSIQIGGAAENERNLISGNTYGAIDMFESDRIRVLGNWIGLNAAGDPLGNGGSAIGLVFLCSGVIIGGTEAGEGNVIAHSGVHGVYLHDSEIDENTIRGNSIYDNGGVAIRNYGGANGGILPPQLSENKSLGGTTTPNAIVDFYADATDEAKLHLGSTIADGDGLFTVTVDLNAAPADSFLTATVTDTSGNTSELSAPLEIPAGSEGEGEGEGEGEVKVRVRARARARDPWRITNTRHAC